VVGQLASVAEHVPLLALQLTVEPSWHHAVAVQMLSGVGAAAEASRAAGAVAVV
jgi:hypothetical protein